MQAVFGPPGLLWDPEIATDGPGWPVGWTWRHGQHVSVKIHLRLFGLTKAVPWQFGNWQQSQKIPLKILFH